ncbi:hypothetical protein SAY87_020782 [Trapa incisa]|uniref:Uncharacterized protein n=1 Tax=Trapa incisa TaxID=236973 RepID=A0AAN7PPX1_9MYRT|nr:hypothetical protein SAY87_020782 [Trapa incisa]
MASKIESLCASPVEISYGLDESTEMKMMTAKPFDGASVFLSRRIVPPEIFDSFYDALKQNGSQVFFCCDPSRNGPQDYHVIYSPDHEKFEDLRAKGCKLVGPPCVISRAKERKSLPEQLYACCLAMDGVKVLASGFEMNEKWMHNSHLGHCKRWESLKMEANSIFQADIEKLVYFMGGILQIKTSHDVSFVVGKNVLAAKYKCFQKCSPGALKSPDEAP